MEAEIGADGAVLVEGHPVGELQGFRFTPDTKSEGLDAKAVRAAAQKALGGEFDARAERYYNAPNGDLALGSDGLVRWLGVPVAALQAGDDALKPRSLILADEQLSGSARDRVVQRTERFVTYQISTTLKPLADLQSAEGLEGTARGIAYRLVENFGLLERRAVAEDVRALDQTQRAALRRLGVRFGAYHVFVPALIKPAPANLLTLLWVIRSDGRDKQGLGEVTQLLATGRTSVQTDPAFDAAFYTLAGYRPLGRRAVRVDILERLADLIRPALAWNPGAGKRPDGGYNGREFLVTPAMMSILGATADDMDEILGGLGYRSTPIEAAEIAKRIGEADAADAKKVADAAAAALAAPQTATVDDGATEALAELGDELGSLQAESVSSDEAPASSGEGIDETPPVENQSPDAVDAHDDASHPDAIVAADAQADDSGSIKPAADRSALTPEASTDDTKTEARLVRVWRPGRIGGERVRGGREERGGQRNRRNAAQAQGEPDATSNANRPSRRPERRDGPNAGKGGTGERPREDRGGAGGKPRFEKRGADKPVAEPRRIEKPRVADPDSPFAKLAALKDKLKR